MTDSMYERAAWVEPPSDEYKANNPDWDKPPKKEKPPPPPMRVVHPALLQGLQIPVRQWIVPDWLPVGYTTLLYGDGGVGKTLLAQLLMTACATGVPWSGLQVKRCRAFGFFCEDDEAELHRRQAQINEFFGLQFSDLKDMRWVSGVGSDNVLVRFDVDGRPIRTDRLTTLQEEIEHFKPELVVIDTAADTFGGNENDRGQVRQFIGGVLSSLAQSIEGAVLLNAHPSRSGMSITGDMDGGSTGWSNSARSRWSLVRPKGDDVAADTNERILTRRKANYASIGDEIPLFWTQGVLAPRQAEGGIIGAIKRQAAEEIFLALLDRCRAQDIFVSGSKNASNFAPKIFAKRPDSEGYRAKDFDLAMSSLFTQRRIRMESYGRIGDARQRIVREAGEPVQEASE